MSMIFVNLLIFALITFLIYYIVPSKFQWVVLLTASFIFYAILDIKALIYVIYSICSIYFCGIMISFLHNAQAELFENKDKSWLLKRKKEYINKFNFYKKIILNIGLLSNFGILAALKYFNFFTGLFNSFFSRIFDISIPGVNWLLPIGISFYTFQAIGYLIDVYRNKYQAEKNIAKLALFISFFPQIMQGPIGRYDHLGHQLFSPHKFSYKMFTNGIKLMGWGFFKKLLIADILSPYIGRILNDDSAIGITVITGIVMYMLQIYADFSGGIDVSRGMAECMGIKLDENFRRPHFAVSISDYWRRWHITLGAWMKDYLLYSITFSKGFSKLQKFSRKKLGNYLGKLLPTCIAMFFVFIVVGIWHGAAIKFLFFGFYNGSLIALGILTKPFIEKILNKLPGNLTKSNFIKVLAIIKTLILVAIGKCYSIANGFLHGCRLIKRTLNGLLSYSNWKSLTDNLNKYRFSKEKIIQLIIPLVTFLIISILQENGINIRESFAKKPLVLRWAVYYLAVTYILVFSELANIGVFLYALF